ncbi:MAG: hypothetical protein AAFX87_20970 [Bacteroidota bacterium]
MNFKARATTIILLLIGLSASYSQPIQGIQSGFIVNNDGDTLTGQIDYKEGVKSFEFCDFKRSGEASTKQYAPKDIKGYGVGKSTYFETINLPLDEGQSQKVFAQVLVKGLITLHNHKGKYLISKNNEGPYVLKNTKSETVVNNKTVVKSSREYLRILNFVMADCQSDSYNFENVKLTHKSLIGLVSKYHKCQSVASVIYQDEQSSKISFMPIIGYSSTSISFSSNSTNSTADFISQGDFSAGGSPNIGIGAILSFPNTSTRVGFLGAIIYKSTENNASTTLTPSAGVIEVNQLSIELSTLHVPIGVRYYFPQQNFSPYVTGGFAINAHIQNDATRTLIRESGGATTTTEEEAFEVKGSTLGAWAGIGAEKKFGKHRFFGEIKYEKSEDIIAGFRDTSTTLKSSVNHFAISLGIIF